MDRQTDGQLDKNLESIGVCDGMGGQGQYRLGRGGKRGRGVTRAGLRGDRMDVVRRLLINSL